MQFCDAMQKTLVLDPSWIILKISCCLLSHVQLSSFWAKLKWHCLIGKMHVHFFFSLFPSGHLHVRMWLENLESLNKLPSTRVFITAKKLIVRITQRLLELEFSSEQEPAALKMVKKYPSFVRIRERSAKDKSTLSLIDRSKHYVLLSLALTAFALSFWLQFL